MPAAAIRRHSLEPSPWPLPPTANSSSDTLALQNGLIPTRLSLSALPQLDQGQEPWTGRAPRSPGATWPRRIAPCWRAWPRPTSLGHDRGCRERRASAAVSAGRSTRESLARIDDPEIGGSLAIVGLTATQHDDADQTATYSVGTATSDGQRFRVLRPHARGGLGAVFVALDGELHREVAPEGRSLTATRTTLISRQRLVQEAEITGGLEHPGIVPVYGLGSYGDGRPFYGDAVYPRRQPEGSDRCGFHSEDAATSTTPAADHWSCAELLRRFLDVCNAIDYAHGRGVLHRGDQAGQHHRRPARGDPGYVDWGLDSGLGAEEIRQRRGRAAAAPQLLLGGVRKRCPVARWARRPT